MLKQRLITGLILAFIFVAVLFLLPPFWFALGFGGLLTIGLWEWSNLAGLRALPWRLAYTIAAIALTACCGWLTSWAHDDDAMRSLLLLACLWWSLALLWIQGFPSSALIWGTPPVRLLMGLLIFPSTWLAALYVRKEPAGAWLVFFVVLLVAAADVGAYFAGRALGRRKLAPAVSPGKTWEGVAGGLMLACVVAAGFNLVFGLQAWLTLFILVVPTALISVVGDLLESMVKRHRGVKDSGQLLPGHGGVLDRIDGLLAAIPIFALMLMLSAWRI